MDYYVLREDETIEDAAVITEHPEDIDIDAFEFDEGMSLQARFPQPALYQMSSLFPDSRILYDLQSNTMGLLVASQRLQTVFESAGEGKIEFLPIQLMNHRGKIESDQYAIVNVLDVIDCMNHNESIVEYSSLDPEELITIKKLVLDESKIPPQIHLFRLKQDKTLSIVSDSVKSRVEEEELTGMMFIPVEKYDTSFY